MPDMGYWWERESIHRTATEITKDDVKNVQPSDDDDDSDYDSRDAGHWGGDDD